MSTTARVNRDSVIDDIQERQAFGDETAALFLRGVERIAEIQKLYLNLAVQQQSEIVEILKKASEKVPGVPRLPLMELATGAVSRYADTQKSAIDVVVEQSRVWTDMFKDRTATINKSTESTTNIARQALERSFAVQKKVLENTAEQTRATVDAAKNQFGWAGTQAEAVTDTFQRGVDAIVDAQKELLEVVAR